MFANTFHPCLAAGLLTIAGITHAAGFTFASATVKPDSTLTEAQVFNGFGCSGKNISPALSWRGAPVGTKSFAITVYDPDAPTGSGWWHWVVFNIPASTTGLPEGAGAAGSKVLPVGAVQGRTDFGAPGFGGACPPQGDKPHRYVFTIHALKTDKIEVPADASAALVGFMIHGSQIGQASFTAKYGR
jgi:Raf kinase inhibitor-like YbhB/YbcL family protein